MRESMLLYILPAIVGLVAVGFVIRRSLAEMHPRRPRIRPAIAKCLRRGAERIEKLAEGELARFDRARLRRLMDDVELTDDRPPDHTRDLVADRAAMISSISRLVTANWPSESVVRAEVSLHFDDGLCIHCRIDPRSETTDWRRL